MSEILSRLTVGAIGLTCKTFLNLGYCSSVKVSGLDHLRRALEDGERENGRGVITVSNHISTLDDPVTWGILPASWYLSSRTTRWTLGASDIMFTNPLFSTFFRTGQVLETFRGRGIFQPAIDSAIAKLDSGEWVHLFGEGKVNQPGFDVGAGEPRLARFKWGVGRILMEARRPPIIIPMWLTGFDKLMPEGRPFPYKFFPRRGVALSVTFGSPIPLSSIKSALNLNARRIHEELPMTGEHEGSLPLTDQRETHGMRSKEVGGWVGGSAEGGEGGSAEGWVGGSTADSVVRVKDREGRESEARIRSAVTAVVHREVEALGRRVAQAT